MTTDFITRLLPSGPSTTGRTWKLQRSATLDSRQRRTVPCLFACGADNDHVFRNRAPLFIAQVDPKRLCALRATEQILMPETGVDLAGGFAPVDVSSHENWVISSEMAFPEGQDQNNRGAISKNLFGAKPNLRFTVSNSYTKSQELSQALHSESHHLWYAHRFTVTAGPIPFAIVDLILSSSIPSTLLYRAQLSWMCQAYSLIGLPPLVRIPSHDPISYMMVLDGGAAGIIAPYVETAEQVQALCGGEMWLIKRTKLQRTDPRRQNQLGLKTYIDEAAKNRLLIVNIESTPAMDALDEILAVPGLDGVLIGPHDLSCSLGLPEQYDHPHSSRPSARPFCRKARAARLAAGIHFWGSIEYRYASSRWVPTC